MKKILSVLLASAMVLSIVSCTSKKPSDGHRDNDETEVSKLEHIGADETETVIPEPTETEETSETAEATTEATTEAATATTEMPKDFGTASDYVNDIRDTYKYLEIDGEYHVPQVVFDTPYAKEMGDEIRGVFQDYALEISNVGRCHYWYTKYIAFLSPSGVLSVVFVEGGEWDDDIYHVWNFDVMTGNQVDNRTMAEQAGVFDIRTAAMDAVQNYYNNTGMLTVDNYELQPGSFDYMHQAVEDSFSTDRLNGDMPIGLTNEGKLFFVSGLASFGGADWYYEIYDAEGNNLSREEGWVGSPH